MDSVNSIVGSLVALVNILVDLAAVVRVVAELVNDFGTLKNIGEYLKPVVKQVGEK